jgi:hypothetical protein
MRWEIITPFGSTHIHNEDHFSTADHYAKLKGYMVKDRKTGKIVRNYCKSKNSKKEKDNVNKKD